MPVPRMTTRRWMIAVAGIGLFVSGFHFAARCRARQRSIERLERAALKDATAALEATEQLVKGGEISPLLYYPCSRHLLDLQLATSRSHASRLAALRAHGNRMKWLCDLGKPREWDQFARESVKSYLSEAELLFALEDW